MAGVAPLPAVIGVLAATALVASAVARPVGKEPADPTREDLLRVAMIYNIARFVRWPQGEEPVQPVVFCVSSTARIARSYRRLEGKKIRLRPTKVRLIPEGERSFAGCAVAHFAEDGHLSIVDAMIDPFTLTIGESPGFASMGGVVEFVRVGKQQRFSINVAASRKADLKISSRLIDLAVRIE